MDKFITQNNIVEWFNDDKSRNTMKLYTSYVGNIKTQGYKSIGSRFSVLEPAEITFKKRDLFKDEETGEELEIIDHMKSIDTLITQVSGNTGYYPSTPPSSSKNKMIPDHNDNFGQFGYHFNIEIDGEETRDSYLIDTLKYFPTIELAELNFIRMLTVYVEKVGLRKSLKTYDKLIEKHEELSPNELLKII